VKEDRWVVGVVAIFAVALFSLSALATTAELYFSSDKNGQNRVTNIQEGDEVWIVVYDPDENIDCDVRDKIWTEVKLFDPKTGAHITWVSYMDENGDANGIEFDDDPEAVGPPDYTPYRGHSPGNPGWLEGDYLEETGADTGLFVSKRAFQIGTREDYDVERMNTHVICTALSPVEPGGPWLLDFAYGGFIYVGGFRRYIDGDLVPQAIDQDVEWDDIDEFVFPDDAIRDLVDDNWLVGRFENMDTLVGMYQDQNDDTDVAVAMMKIDDVEAVVSWDQEIYKDCNGAATLTVDDWDENLNCNEIEYVPVFIIVNPGSWNPVQTGAAGVAPTPDSPTTFCALKRSGGVDGTDGTPGNNPMRWYNMYHSEVNAFNAAGAEDGRYYMEYPVAGDNNVVAFDTQTPSGIVPVSYYAQETGVNTGVFQLNLNSICDDLGFNTLDVRDVLVAYYLDPNDEDDFKLSVAYIEERQHSITSFTDETRTDQETYWIGRDPIYVQVIDSNANVDPCCPEQVVVHLCDPHCEDDAEWWILDETSSNSPVFFSNAGMQLLPVWDALGTGIDPANRGGYQVQMDNWKFETFNENDVYARYNDVYYWPNESAAGEQDGLNFLGDITANNQRDTAFPPRIQRVRVDNDLSFDLMHISDTQVWDGQTTQMWFLDRNGNRVSGYVNSDCVFVEVIDADQNEDILRRERIDAFWDGGQGGPIGPMALNDWDCGVDRDFVHDWNTLFGDTNIFNNAPANGDGVRYETANAEQTDINDAGWGKLYVANPRNGRWAAVDLLETGVSTGDFVSVICIDLVSVHDCEPTLGVLPGDTILAVYQDPSNHSDSAWISVKVGVGGSSGTTTQSSTTSFVDSAGVTVSDYTDADLVYVKVIDPSHAGATVLADAVEIDGVSYDVEPLAGANSDTFITDGLDLGLVAGESITATYTDPTDPTDTSSDTITIIASELDVVRFYAAPNPFDGEAAFGFEGSGVASVFKSWRT